MKKTFNHFILLMTAFTLIGFASCSDDDDSVAPTLTSDSFIGTAIVTYTDTEHSTPQTESFTAIVLAHSNGNDELNIDLHRQSEYYAQWMQPESLLKTAMPFYSTQTGAASAEGAHFNQSELAINYNYKSAEADENGRTLLSIKFTGQPNPQPVKNEINPVGTFTSVTQKYYELYCYQPEEFQYYSQLTDINEITDQWNEYAFNERSVSIEKSTKQNQLVVTEYNYGIENDNLKSVGIRYTVNFDKNIMSFKHQTNRTVDNSLKINNTYSFTVNENNSLILLHTDSRYDELGQFFWPENAIGVVTYTVTTLTK